MSPKTPGDGQNHMKIPSAASGGRWLVMFRILPWPVNWDGHLPPWHCKFGSSVACLRSGSQVTSDGSEQVGVCEKGRRLS